MRETQHIYLVPGFFGFANLGKLTYFGHVRALLAQRCAASGLLARIHVVKTLPTSSLPRRAVRIAETMAATMRGHGAAHVIGHSSGGLDARLLVAPQVSLPTPLDVGRLADRVRTVITVSTPHFGTPLASFFNSLLGERLLRVLSLSTIYLLRFGHLPLRALLQLGAIFARLDNLAMNSAVLDEVFGLLLRQFSAGRRHAVQALFAEVARDQSLLVQLTPEAMELFNAAIHNRPGVRYACVTSAAQRPGLRSTLATGLDPSAQAIHAVYRTLYRVAAQMPRERAPRLAPEPVGVLRRAYGSLPSLQANDGVVPTRSQVWGEIIHAARADHLDVIGHFQDPLRNPPHVDWLATGSAFTREKFEALWTAVVRCITSG